MATYLVQLLAGTYYVVDGGTAGRPGRADRPRRAHRRRGPDAALLRPHRRQIGFFESLFGPYPLDRYGLAFTDSYAGLAMETQGRSMYSRDDFPGDVGYFEDLLAQPRIGPSVVRQRRHACRLGRHLAQRVVRHLRPVDVVREVASRRYSASPGSMAFASRERGADGRADGVNCSHSAVRRRRGVLHALRLESGTMTSSRCCGVGGGERRHQRRTAEFIALSEEVVEVAEAVLRHLALRRRRPRPVPVVTGACASARRASPAPVATPPPAGRPAAARDRSARSARPGRHAGRVDAQPPPWLVLPGRRVVPDPRQLAEIALLAGHQLGQGAPGQVGRGHAVSGVAAGERQPAPCGRRDLQAPVPGAMPRGPPRVERGTRRRRAPGSSSRAAAASRARTRSSVSKPAAMREPAVVGRAPPAEGQAAVGRALAVDEEVPAVGERGPIGQPIWRHCAVPSSGSVATIKE